MVISECSQVCFIVDRVFVVLPGQKKKKKRILFMPHLTGLGSQALASTPGLVVEMRMLLTFLHSLASNQVAEVCF
jgi:hypothetical protein